MLILRLIMKSGRQWVAPLGHSQRRFAVVLLLLCTWLGGCASAPVQRGALIGAIAGAAAGAGAGLLISDENLLGSSKQSQIELQRGSAVGAGAVIGVVFGAIVGSMIGHGSEDKYPPPPNVPPPTDPADSAAALGGTSEGVQARAGQVRQLPSPF